MPLWDGKPAEGKTILIHAEQGFGDTIQAARYLPLVADRGARVLVACQVELVRLLQDASGRSLAINGVWALSPGNVSPNNNDAAAAPATEMPSIGSPGRKAARASLQASLPLAWPKR